MNETAFLTLNFKNCDNDQYGKFSRRLILLNHLFNDRRKVYAESPM